MRILMILKKLLKLAVSIGLAFAIVGSLFDSFTSNPSAPEYMAGLKPHFTVVFTLAFYAACTLTGFLFEKGFVVFSIISFPFTYAIVGALGMVSCSVFAVSLTEFWEYIIVVLAVAAMLWAPILDIVRVIRGYD